MTSIDLIARACSWLMVAQTAPPAPRGHSFGQMFMSMGFVGLLMIVVVVVMLIITARRFSELRLDRLAPETLQKSLERSLHDRAFDRASSDATASHSFLGDVVVGGLYLRDAGLDEMLSNVERVATKSSIAIGNRVANLARWGGAALLIGLLGTIAGLIAALFRIEQLKNPTVTDFVVGIGESLTCMAFALLLALLSFGAFFWLDFRLTQRVLKVREMAEEMMRVVADRTRPPA